MTKAEIVNEVAKATGIEKAEVLSVLEASMECVKNSVASGTSPKNPLLLFPLTTFPHSSRLRFLSNL